MKSRIADRRNIAAMRLPAGAHIVVGSMRAIWGLFVAMKHHRDFKYIAGLDDRMLADIGLTRADVRDADSQPLWQDRTAVLARRAAERRAARSRQ